MSNPIDVFRVAPDGLSREAWRFRPHGTHGFFLALDTYGIERRKQPKGRWAAARQPDRWNSSDERYYYSGLKRPDAIPIDVMLEAISKMRVLVTVGWSNADRVKGEFEITAQPIKGCANPHTPPAPPSTSRPTR